MIIFPSLDGRGSGRDKQEKPPEINYYLRDMRIKATNLLTEQIENIEVLSFNKTNA